MSLIVLVDLSREKLRTYHSYCMLLRTKQMLPISDQNPELGRGMEKMKYECRLRQTYYYIITEDPPHIVCSNFLRF